MQKGGFFNSTDHDRRYSALDFNQLIDTIKSDGIDQYGDKLEVIAGEGLNVIVKSGKAYYNQHWLFNDANLTIELEQASPTQDRIDAIIIEVNETDRTMLIKAVTGEPSDTPVAPSLVDTTNIHQYYLAWVEVGTGSLVVGTITDKRTDWADIESVRQDENELTTSNLVNSLASVENTNVASKNYDVGDYLTMNGVLYKVAVAITQGDTLVVGTNITSTDTGTELVGAINLAKASAINLATIEATNIASQTYTVGSYLVYNGLLYKVTSAIAQGGTLQVGVNIQQTKVGNELEEINSFDYINSTSRGMNLIAQTGGWDIYKFDQVTATVAQEKINNIIAMLNGYKKLYVELYNSTNYSCQIGSFEVSKIVKGLQKIIDMITSSSFASAGNSMYVGAIQEFLYAKNTSITTYPLFDFQFYQSKYTMHICGGVSANTYKIYAE